MRPFALSTIVGALPCFLVLASVALGQSTNRLRFLGSASSAEGELSQRGGAGGSAAISWRIAGEEHRVSLRSEVGMHVFRSARTTGPTSVSITSTTPYFPSVALLAYSKPILPRIGAYGLVGPAAFGSYGPIVWGVGGIAGIGVRPATSRIGLEGRISAARVPNPDVGPKRFFDARIVSVGITLSR